MCAVLRVCVWRPHGPRIACFSLECELTHTYIYTHTNTHPEKVSRQLPLILHILSPLNNATHPELSPPSKLPPLTSYVCLCTVSVYVQGISTPHTGRRGGKQRPRPKTYRGKIPKAFSGRKRKCWGGFGFLSPLVPAKRKKRNSPRSETKSYILFKLAVFTVLPQSNILCL